MKKQTAGRDRLGKLAPKFAELNDDVLFGQVWAREKQLPLKIRSMLTVTTLMTKGIFDSSLKAHITSAKANGVTKQEMVELVTHVAFYAGWPNAWATFSIIMEIYGEDEQKEKTKAGTKGSKDSLFGLGEPNTAYSKYFVGNSYLKMLTNQGVKIANVTFEPACRNNWHIHHKGGQILLCTDGEGWYQEAGKKATKLVPGSVVYIAPEVKHWHGAAKDSWFTHLAVEVPAARATTEWCEQVDDKQYGKLK